MRAVNFIRILQASSAHQFYKTFDGVFMVVGYALGFIFHDQTLHVIRILRGNPARAGVLVAFQSLNTPQRVAWMSIAKSGIVGRKKSSFRKLIQTTVLRGYLMSIALGNFDFW